MRTRPTILCRCDGHRDIGHGHVSRSLALAESFEDMGCECVFVGSYDAAVRLRLDTAGMQCEPLEAVSWTSADASVLKTVAADIGACAVVADSYLFGVDYLEHLGDLRLPVLVIDDFASLASYPCAAVLNFTTRAASFDYPQGSARYFLGPSYFPARRALRDIRARGEAPVREAQRVLVACGAHNADDIVGPIVDALLGCERDLDVHIVTGEDLTQLSALRARLALFRGKTSIRSQLPDLSGELAWADSFVTTAGLMKYEAGYLGVPSAVVSQNEGQALDAARFGELGLAVDLGKASEIDSEVTAARIARLVMDIEFRKSLQRRCLSVFSIDATRELATTLLSEVFSSWPH